MPGYLWFIVGFISGMAILRALQEFCNEYLPGRWF